MKIYLSQIYIEVGIAYCFNTLFQKKISLFLTEATDESKLFVHKYGRDFKLIFRMSAKAGISDTEVCGPAVFRKDKDVEYTIFIPYDFTGPDSFEARRKALKLLFSSILVIFKDLDIDTKKVEAGAEQFIEDVVNDKTFLETDEY
jgi:hypothetical protein